MTLHKFSKILWYNLHIQSKNGYTYLIVESSIAHGRQLGEKMFWRFCIVNVLARACDYPSFDPDKYSNWAFILWDLLDTESTKRVVIEQGQGTEAWVPKVASNSPAIDPWCQQKTWKVITEAVKRLSRNPYSAETCWKICRDCNTRSILHEFVTGNTDVKINCLRRCLQDLEKEKDEDIDGG